VRTQTGRGLLTGLLWATSVFSSISRCSRKHRRRHLLPSASTTTNTARRTRCVIRRQASDDGRRDAFAMDTGGCDTGRACRASHALSPPPLKPQYTDAPRTRTDVSIRDVDARGDSSGCSSRPTGWVMWQRNSDVETPCVIQQLDDAGCRQRRPVTGCIKCSQRLIDRGRRL